jgi:hypothetical protein
VKHALAAVLLVAAAEVPAHADLSLSPTFVLDGDYRVAPHNDVETYDGFAFARAQAGARGDVSDDVTIAALFDFAAGETVTIIDAYAMWHATRELDLAGGYLRSPLFPSARDEFVERLPVPELGTVVRGLWPGRTIGASLRYRPVAAPIDVQVKLGNGSSAVGGNDTNKPAGDLRVDYVWGRTTAKVDYGRVRDGTPRPDTWGVRVGVGGHVDNVDSRPGASGFTASGYEFYRPAVVAGTRYLGEAHALVQDDAWQLLVEAGYTREGREMETNPDPTAPRTKLTSVDSYGIAGELSYMITGDHRIAGAWPLDRTLAHTLGAVEVAARVERGTFGSCATAAVECTSTVEKLDADVASAAVRWWVHPAIALSAAAYYYHWDAAAYDEPTVRSTYLLLGRMTVSFR